MHFAENEMTCCIEIDIVLDVLRIGNSYVIVTFAAFRGIQSEVSLKYARRLCRFYPIRQ